MIWQYACVFLGAFLVDVVPLPLPPAFTVMMLLQILFKLDLWVMIAFGVAGSVAGRYVLALYIPRVSGRLFKPSKNRDVQFLGRRMKTKGWKGQALILVYSLLPLPTTPLFIAGGMARVHPLVLLPPFVVGKVISDTAAVLMGSQALRSAQDLVTGILSWKSIAGLALGILLVAALLFMDWRSLLQHGRVRLRFAIWK